MRSLDNNDVLTFALDEKSQVSDQQSCSPVSLHPEDSGESPEEFPGVEDSLFELLALFALVGPEIDSHFLTLGGCIQSESSEIRVPLLLDVPVGKGR